MADLTSQTFADYLEEELDETQLAQIDIILTAVKKQFFNLTGRVFSTDPDNEEFVESFANGYATQKYFLRNPNVTEIVSLEVGNPFLNDWAEYDGNHYIDGNCVVTDALITTTEDYQIRITYKGGAMPDDVVQALKEWGAAMWARRHDKGKDVKNEGFGSESVSYDVNKGIPANVQAVIDSYRIPNL